MRLVIVLSTPGKPFFGDVVKTLLGLKSEGAQSTNQREAGSGNQRASSSACFSNGYLEIYYIYNSWWLTSALI